MPLHYLVKLRVHLLMLKILRRQEVRHIRPDSIENPGPDKNGRRDTGKRGLAANSVHRRLGEPDRYLFHVFTSRRSFERSKDLNRVS